MLVSPNTSLGSPTNSKPFIHESPTSYLTYPRPPLTNIVIVDPNLPDSLQHMCHFFLKTHYVRSHCVVWPNQNPWSLTLKHYQNLTLKLGTISSPTFSLPSATLTFFDSIHQTMSHDCLIVLKKTYNFPHAAGFSPTSRILPSCMPNEPLFPKLLRPLQVIFFLHCSASLGQPKKTSLTFEFFSLSPFSLSLNLTRSWLLSLLSFKCLLSSMFINTKIKLPLD